MDQERSDASPSASEQAAQTRSRLPPNTVARKAPQKATATPAPMMQGSPKVAKPKFKDVKKVRLADMPKQTLAPLAVARKSAKEVTPPPQLSGPTTSLPAGSKKALTWETKKQEAAGPAPLSLNTNLERHNQIGTLSTSLSPDAFINMAKEVGVPVATSQRPQPRFEFSLTPQLESIKRAFGQDNWTEYIILVEKHVLEEITDKRFGVQERRIFQVPGVGMRKKIRRLVLEQMVSKG